MVRPAAPKYGPAFFCRFAITEACVTEELTQPEILRELEPVAEQNLNRHLSMAKDWHPHTAS